MRLDIVMPAHNEEHRIGRTLRAYRAGCAHPATRFLVALDATSAASTSRGTGRAGTCSATTTCSPTAAPVAGSPTARRPPTPTSTPRTRSSSRPAASIVPACGREARRIARSVLAPETVRRPGGRRALVAGPWARGGGVVNPLLRRPPAFGLGARLDPALRGGGAALLPRERDGAPAPGAVRHAVALVGAAGAARAAGDRARARALLARAQALDRAHPTYYGAAWAALGRVLLTTRMLGRC